MHISISVGRVWSPEDMKLSLSAAFCGRGGLVNTVNYASCNGGKYF